MPRPVSPGPTRLDRDDARLYLAVAAAAVTVVLTGTAFWLSYQHLAEVAASHSLQRAEVRAWAWPATIDLFIIVGELLILRASLMGRLDGWAIGLTIVGSVASVMLNVAGVGADASVLDYVVAATPPTAALLAFGALMRQLHEHLTSTDVRATQADLAPHVAPTSGDVEDDVEPANPIEAVIRPLYGRLGRRPSTAQMTAAMSAAGLRPVASTARDARRRLEKREPQLLRRYGNGIGHAPSATPTAISPSAVASLDRP
ncbi:DUF2637 domain-containing protein [Yinghuangia soli]|uniref:DUF2637 domain-containing protein n=1 Tax=Yinghuangia soli TaxID=2908204 RepID=A0AA41Q4I8_9ACTN|nr:DUF2637 domain-containing protein [Yinghuangia soli]MCF2531191.1 DUF2637 domain-containing protein [Yinghuangia soli]